MKTLINILISACILFSATVNAHVGLTSSHPTAGETLTESPTHIAMTFAGEVRLAKVMLHSDSGKMFPLDFTMNMKPETTFKILLEEGLPNGNYTVYWTAMGDDGHKLSGDFSFSVKS